MEAIGKNEVRIEIEMDAEPSLGAVAQFLSGVTIMREALTVSVEGDSASLVARLAGLHSPLLWMPEMLVESCGAAWVTLGDWPPMDAMFRGGITQGLLQACVGSRGPTLQRLQAGSLVCILKEFGGGVRSNLVRALSATKLLIGRAERRAFTEEMQKVLGVRAKGVGLEFPGALPVLGRPTPELLAAGTMMFACQAIEGSFAALGAQGIQVSTEPGGEGRRAKRRSR
jgi:hypothetical protein